MGGNEYARYKGSIHRPTWEEFDKVTENARGSASSSIEMKRPVESY